MGQWRHSFAIGQLSATMQIAKRVYSLAQERNDTRLMMGAYNALASTLYFLGDFETSGQHAMRGVQLWRSGGGQPPVEEVDVPAVACLCYAALRGWHFGEITSYQATIAEAISLAKKLNDMHGLAVALNYAASLAYNERNFAKMERYSSDLVELSTRHHFAHWMAIGTIYHGSARSACGDTAEGLAWIEGGIEGWRATGAIVAVPYYLGLKAEALHLANRTPEAIEAINEAEAVAERREERWWSAELHRLRGVFLAAASAEETQIEASFCEALRIAKEQKSVSLKKRAEATYTEYRRQKASGSAGRGFRLPLW
jgi:adenylate cyclase